MSDVQRWVVVAVLVACVVGLIIWARGPNHHRGEDVGAVQAPYGVSVSLSG
jgi:hypothetical protein